MFNYFVPSSVIKNVMVNFRLKEYNQYKNRDKVEKLTKFGLKNSTLAKKRDTPLI